MSSVPIFEGFSLSHAAILAGPITGTGAEAYTVYGVQNGTLAPDQGNFENTGDDVVLSEHFWINFCNVTIAAGFIPFSTLAAITGTAVSSSGASPNDYYALPLWTLNSMNQPTWPMAIRVPSKDSGGTVRTLDFILYRVQFQPFGFTGPSYKTGMVVSIAGRALFSSVSETGASLPATYPLSIGRMVSLPGQETGVFNPEPFPSV